MLNFYQFNCILEGIRPYSEHELTPLTHDDMLRYAQPEVSLDAYNQIQDMDIQNVQALDRPSKMKRVKGFNVGVRQEPTPEELKKYTGFEWH